MQTNVRWGWAAASVVSLLLAAACAAPQNLSSTSPQLSSSPTEKASPSPSPSPTAPLAISSFAFHTGEVGLAYSPVTLGATGGLPPYSWSVAGGSLPPGLTLSSGGVVSGSNTTPGSFSFTIKVSDSSDGAVTKAGAVAVVSALTSTQPCVGQCVIGKGCTKCGVFGTVSRGLTPYTYKIVGGAVPPGMTWKQLSLVGGFPAGGYSLTVRITDQLGGTETVSANWSVYNPATLIRGATSDCVDTGPTQDLSCTATWTYTGGNPTVAPTLVITGYTQYGTYPKPTGLPPGWTVGINRGVITMSASSNVCVTAYSVYINFVLRDPSKCATTLASNQGTMLVDLRYSC